VDSIPVTIHGTQSLLFYALFTDWVPDTIGPIASSLARPWELIHRWTCEFKRRLMSTLGVLLRSLSYSNVARR